MCFIVKFIQYLYWKYDKLINYWLLFNVWLIVCRQCCTHSSHLFVSILDSVQKLMAIPRSKIQIQCIQWMSQYLDRIIINNRNETTIRCHCSRSLSSQSLQSRLVSDFFEESNEKFPNIDRCLQWKQYSVCQTSRLNFFQFWTKLFTSHSMLIPCDEWRKNSLSDELGLRFRAVSMTPLLWMACNHWNHWKPRSMT